MLNLKQIFQLLLEVGDVQLGIGAGRASGPGSAADWGTSTKPAGIDGLRILRHRGELIFQLVALMHGVVKICLRLRQLLLCQFELRHVIIVAGQESGVLGAEIRYALVSLIELFRIRL